MHVQVDGIQSRVALALARACEHLLSLQDPAGWWKGELETNVSMDAEDMLLREFLGIREPLQTERAAERIRSKQRDDGTWANFYDAPGDLSTTVEAYWALKLAGDPVDAPHMRAAAEFVLERGGVQEARVFTHIWMALFGLWPWDQVPCVPPEIVFVPRWVPLNIYDYACWARQTIVALSIVMTHRPCHQLGFGLDELHGPQPWQPARGRSALGRWLARLDRAVHLYSRHAIGPLRRLALARAERWVVDRQEADGSWGGIQPPWVYSLMALRLCGRSGDDPVMARGIAGIDGFMIDDAEGGRRLEACQSPVWDTALSIIALRDAGFADDHPALLRAADWMLGEEVTVRGDWAVQRPRLRPGGWAFEFANVNYPDVDDTTEVVLALARVRLPDQRLLAGAIERAVEWVQGMQSRGGGWAAFDADNTRAIVRELPFFDFGEVIDDPSADVTAHAVEMYAALGRAGEPAVQAGIAWLTAQQEPGGSWYGRWGVNHIYGTAAVLPALAAAGVAPSDERVRRAVRWLEQCQNEDGGWGEDPRSYVDASWIGRGPSTASQTAWALIALHAAGERSAAMERGVAWLIETQREDGTWDEPQYTGTGFPGDFYINYHLYRLTFPIMALGRCLSGQA